ncbi:uncharacterized protein LOC131232981 [Magnolia sinica]|uniref:uncharacterized protein LOC131232981 n=1 Tax=Magnolia sinica TaxID=86752 RepID=UPI002658E269|nr:uncharacterized protein LOC131232981 [Magnolia sinica]
MPSSLNARHFAFSNSSLGIKVYKWQLLLCFLGFWSLPSDNSLHQEICAFQRNPIMGQKLVGLWGRVQGKPHLRKICDKVFDECVARNGRHGLVPADLHRAILLAYNVINKHFPGPHKEPPSAEVVAATVERFHEAKVEGIDREQFYQLILGWTWKYMQNVVINKILVALLAAPAMTEITKRASRLVPKIQNVVEMIPTPVLISAYTVGFVLVQDFEVPIN